MATVVEDECVRKRAIPRSKGIDDSALRVYTKRLQARLGRAREVREEGDFHPPELEIVPERRVKEKRRSTRAAPPSPPSNCTLSDTRFEGLKLYSLLTPTRNYGFYYPRGCQVSRTRLSAFSQSPKYSLPRPQNTLATLPGRKGPVKVEKEWIECVNRWVRYATGGAGKEESNQRDEGKGHGKV